MTLTARQEQLKAEFVRARGYWSDLWNDLLTFDPDYFELFATFSSHPGKAGLIDPKLRSFIGIAVDSSVTHMYAAGLPAQIHGARKSGATADEIFAVLELASGLGQHTLVTAVPILLEELAANGEAVETSELTESQVELKAQFVAEHGYWSTSWAGLLILDPDFFEICLKLSSHVRDNALEPKVRELILIAIDASPTHLYEAGIREHIWGALEAGATKEEILTVLEMVSGLGVHTMAIGLPALRETIGPG